MKVTNFPVEHWYIRIGWSGPGAGDTDIIITPRDTGMMGNAISNTQKQAYLTQVYDKMIYQPSKDHISFGLVTYNLPQIDKSLYRPQ